MSASLGWLEEPVDVDEVAITAPTELRIGAYPNPFNPRTALVLTGMAPGEAARIRVANIAGQTVMSRDFTPQAGTLTIPWDGTDRQGRALGSGVYLLSAEQSGRRAVRKVLLVR